MTIAETQDLVIGDRIKYKEEIYQIIDMVELYYVILDKPYEEHYDCLDWEELEYADQVKKKHKFES